MRGSAVSERNAREGGEERRGQRLNISARRSAEHAGLLQHVYG